jgi:peroxiredoxin
MAGSGRFRKTVAGVVLAVLLGGVLVILFYLYGRASVEPIALGSLLPDVRLHTSNGGPASLQTVISRKALVLFFTVDCPHCVTEIQHFAALHTTKKDSLQFLFVSLSSADDTRRFFSTWRDIIPVVRAEPEEANGALGIITLPLLFCIDDGGRVVYRRFGERPFEADEDLVHILIREVL